MAAGLYDLLAGATAHGTIRRRVDYEDCTLDFFLQPDRILVYRDDENTPFGFLPVRGAGFRCHLDGGPSRGRIC